MCICLLSTHIHAYHMCMYICIYRIHLFVYVYMVLQGMCMHYAREKIAYQIELYKFICCILFNFIFAVDSSVCQEKRDNFVGLWRIQQKKTQINLKKIKMQKGKQ